MNQTITVAPQISEICWELKWKLKLKMEIESPRWKRGTKNADSYFRLVLANVYIQRHINDQARKKAMELFSETRAAFDEILTESKWLDVGTRARFRKKMNAMKLTVGFPQWTTDHEKLHKSYEGAEVIPGEKFGTFLRLVDVKRKNEISLSRRNPHGGDRFLFDNMVSAYQLLSNSIDQLWSIGHGNGIQDQPCLWYYGSINYGGLGMIMAHEIFHGFDTSYFDTSREPFENGEKFPKPTNETMGHYIEKVKCLIKQYSSYHWPELGGNSTIDGIKTRDENISDNEGIRLAYRAYQRLQSRSLKKQTLPGFSDYTQDQLFFLSFAQMWCRNYSNEGIKFLQLFDTHSPNRFRIIGALSNNDEFSKAWNCPIGSPMNPSYKCVLW